MSRASCVYALAGALLAMTLPVAGSAREWRSAELWGGDVRALEVDPRDPDYVLAGTFSGQVYVSNDGGAGWRPAGRPGLFAGWSVQTLVFDPNQTRRVWAALTRVWDETGYVAVSDDRGRSWRRSSAGLPGRQVYSLALVPGEPGVVYAGTRVGVYGSRDHGRTWRHLTGSHPELEKVTSLLVDRERRDTVLAGTWRRAYRSEDGGVTWSRLDDGMVLDSEVFSLQPVPGRPGELWASTCGWVYRGRALGDSWVRSSRGLAERRATSFGVLPGGRLLAGTVDGVFASTDDGASWERAGADGLAIHALEHHPERPERVWAGTEGGGVWRSDDGGASFRPSTTGLSSLRVAGLAAAGGEIVAAVRHAGPASGVYSSFDGGRTFPVGPVRLPTVLDVAAQGGRVYAATEEGLYERRDGDWTRLDGLGQARVEEVVALGRRLLARVGEAIYERDGTDFRRRDLAGLRARSLVPAGDEVWLLDVAGRFHRLDDDDLEAIAVAVDVAASGRRIATGDPRWPLLAIGERDSALWPAAGDPFPLELWVEPEEVSSALVRDGRLLLGTVGYGVLVVDLSPARPAMTPIVSTAR